MASGTLERLAALLERGLELPAGERAALLAQLGREDPEAARMLQRSLTGPDDTFLRPLSATRREAALGSPRPALAVAEAAGDEVGPYRLLKVLGAGGMGTVWLAERADGQLTRQVALKLPAMWFPGMEEQVRREADILASLEHPSIARLYDAGVTASGRPYLALEYVDGKPIDAWCQEHRLPVEDCLRLALQVARAVAYAHGRLVVHRDLKPANLLVRPDGQVRLLDFGIARLLDAPPSALTAFSGGQAFTPDFAAPEQLAGSRVTVASDVYSLGVVLYLLLTGQPPYSLGAKETGVNLAERLATTPVAPPSQRASARARAQRLEGDLDVVVLKAMARDPKERYPTMEALAADLERHLAGEPVLARPASLPYRLGKLVRRHRLLVAAGAAVALAVVGGAGVSLWQAGQARAQARRAEAVKAFISEVFTGATPRTGVGGEVRAADLLTAASARLEKDLDREPQVAAELGVLIASGFSNLGEPARGLAAATLAAERAEQALGPRDLLTLRARALQLESRQTQGLYDEAVAPVDPLIADARAAMPASARVLVWALSMKSFALAKRDLEQPSIAVLKEAVALAERHLGPDDDDTISNLGFLANTYGRFSDTPRQLEAATEAMRRATARYGQQRPSVALTQIERWYAEALLFDSRPLEALPILERVVADQRSLDGAETPRVRVALQRLAEAIVDAGQVARALPLSRQVVAMEAAQNRVDSDDRLGALTSLGRTLLAGRLEAEALATLDGLEAVRQRLGTPRRPRAGLYRARALVLAGRPEGERLAAELAGAADTRLALRVELRGLVAQHARLQGRSPEALALAREALGLAGAGGAVPALVLAVVRCELASAALDVGATAEAREALAAATSELERSGAAPSPRTADCAVAGARQALAAGKAAEARGLLAPLDAAYAAVNPGSPFRGEALLHLARAEAALGEPAAAATARRARDLLAASPHPALRSLARR